MNRKRMAVGLSVLFCLLLIAGSIFIVQNNKEERYYATNLSIQGGKYKPVSAKKADTKSIKTGEIRFVVTEEEVPVHKIEGEFVEVENQQDISELLPLHQKPVDVAEETENSIDFMDLFAFRLGEKVPKGEKEKIRKQLLESYEGERLLEFTPETIKRFANGVFGWNYRNTNNKDDFLAFRTGTYFYQDDFLTADELYDAIHERIQKHKLKFDYEFSYTVNDIYSNPVRGGFTVSGILKFKYTSDKGSVLAGYEPDTWYSLEYEADFNWNTPAATDNWPMWDNGATGLSVSQGYVIK